MKSSQKSIDDIFRYKEAKLLELLNVHNSRVKESNEDDKMIQEIFGDLEVPTLPTPKKSSAVTNRSSNNSQPNKKTVNIELQAGERELQLQQLLEQTSLDMNSTLREKQDRINLLTAQLKTKTQQLQQTKDQFVSLKHFTWQFASNVKLLVQKDNLNMEEKNYISKAIAELGTFLTDKKAQEDFITQRRRASLNAVPFDNTALSFTPERIPQPETPPTSQLTHITVAPAPFIHLCEPLEEQVDFLFQRIVHLSQSEVNGSEIVSRGDQAYITRKSFLNMVLALDLIDDKLTFTAAMSAFDRIAQETARGCRKLNNRLFLNDFVNCLSLCADFKYLHIEQSSRLAKLIAHGVKSRLLQDDLAYIHQRSAFDWISDAQIFGLVSRHHASLYKAFCRAKSFGSDVSVSPRSSRSKETTRIAARTDNFTDNSGFFVFSRQFRLFPALTKESVVRRIAQYTQSTMNDGVGCFYASLINLALALSNNATENGRTETKLAAMLKRIFDHVDGELVRRSTVDAKGSVELQKKIATNAVSGAYEHNGI